VQVLVVREVAAHNHQVHGPLVLLVEIAHRLTVRVQDTEPQGAYLLRGSLRKPRYLQRQPGRGGCQTARLRMVILVVVAVVHRSLLHRPVDEATV
jgi:hypothetical protein